MVDRVGDWWNSVFNTPAPSPSDNEVAAVPPVNLEPPTLQPPPSIEIQPTTPGSTQAPVTIPATPAVRPDAPVIADQQPARVPSFPRPLDSSRPVDTIPGTQVYQQPSAPPAAAVGGGTIERTPSTTTAGTIQRTPSTSTLGAGRDTAGTLPSAPRTDTRATTSNGSSRPDATASTSTGGSRADTTASSGTSTTMDTPASSRATPAGETTIAPTGDASGSASPTQ